MSAAAAMHQTIASGAPPAPTATHKLSPPPTATATAPSPAGPPPDAAAPQLNGNAADASPAARKASATAAKSEPSLVAVIRAEQACQMAQARSKGDLHQVQKRMEKDTLRGSAAAAKQYCQEDGLFIDEARLLDASAFPIPPARLIELAKDALRTGVHKCANLADDFQFSAPFVGPLPKEGFAKVMQTLSLDDVFPDMSPRIYHLRVDPLQPNRVWFTTRPIGTNTGFLKAKLPVPQAPTYNVVELPPQTSSISFNERGEVIDFTMGYVQDRRIGNSGGLGGAFGFMWALGVPFPYPEGKPWTSSLQQRLFNSGNPLLQVAMFVLDRISTALLPTWITSHHNRAMP